MTRFVLGIKDLDRLHVGETDDFIQHIGRGAKPGDFDPQRVIDLANDWEIYDEEGFALGAQRTDDGGVALVRVDPPRHVSGAELVTRINYIVGIVQAELDELQSDALKEHMAQVGDVEKTPPDDPQFAQALKDLANSAEQLAGRVTRIPMPVLDGGLDVVLAAMTQLFRAPPDAPPNHGSRAHDDWHAAGHTHR